MGRLNSCCGKNLGPHVSHNTGKTPSGFGNGEVPGASGSTPTPLPLRSGFEVDSSRESGRRLPARKNVLLKLVAPTMSDRVWVVRRLQE